MPTDLQLPDGFVPELIALDIDGTLTEHLGTVSGRVVESIARIKEAGTMVVLATGRTLSTTAPVARAVGLDGWLVCSNGAVLATVEPEMIIETVTFDPRSVLDQLKVVLPQAVYAVEDVHGVFHTTEMFGAGALGTAIRQVPFEHLLTEPVTRLVVRSEEHREEGFGHLVEEMGLHSVIFGAGDVAWMDIGPAGVNKATMLATLCARLNINPTKTLAIGDFWNDIEMLSWAGVGVAMGGAPAAVVAAADTQTSAIPGEGVAQVIEALLAAALFGPGAGVGNASAQNLSAPKAQNRASITRRDIRFAARAQQPRLVFFWHLIA